MTGHSLHDLADRIEADEDSAAGLSASICEALTAAGLAVAADTDPALLARSTDTVLYLIDHAFPGWTVSLDGTASVEHGHWTCVLRQSDANDNDAFLGVGKSDRLPVAALAALLKAMAMRPAG